MRTIEAVWAEFGILLDPIYSSRAIVAARHVRKPDSAVHTVVVHTGGLQGWAGLLGSIAPSPSLRVAIDDALHQAFA
jgi:1-aminocyclopropane-1-carboxylate deaminase/D-cysteine desulfhydrase-like pyridoxal-dependent ACC family enzyme